VNANHWQRWNTSGVRLDNSFNFNGHMGFTNNWDAHAGGTIASVTESYCDRCTRGGPALRKSLGFFPWFGVNTDSRRTVSPSMWVNLWYTDEGSSYGSSIGPNVNLRLSTRFQTNLGVNLTRDHNHTQWYDNITDDAGVTHYAFAHLDQRTVSFSARINYTATKDLTFEFYGQPFVTKGTYSNIREVSPTPGAHRYDDRFQRYTLDPDEPTAFHFAQLRTNAVLRWEYSPGSTLFLVWAHGRQAFENEYNDRSWRRDYRELFELHPDNTFLIKVAYWLNR
jgi:hypothetical protein